MSLIQERSSPCTIHFNRWGAPVRAKQESLTTPAVVTLDFNGTKGRRLLVTGLTTATMVFSFGFGGTAASAVDPIGPTNAQAGMVMRRWVAGEGPMEFIFDLDLTFCKIYTDTAVTIAWTLFPN